MEKTYSFSFFFEKNVMIGKVRRREEIKFSIVFLFVCLFFGSIMMLVFIRRVSDFYGAFFFCVSCFAGLFCAFLVFSFVLCCVPSFFS